MLVPTLEAQLVDHFWDLALRKMAGRRDDSDQAFLEVLRQLTAGRSDRVALQARVLLLHRALHDYASVLEQEGAILVDGGEPAVSQGLIYASAACPLTLATDGEPTAAFPYGIDQLLYCWADFEEWKAVHGPESAERMFAPTEVATVH